MKKCFETRGERINTLNEPENTIFFILWGIGEERRGRISIPHSQCPAITQTLLSIAEYVGECRIIVLIVGTIPFLISKFATVSTLKSSDFIQCSSQRLSNAQLKNS